MTHACAQLLSRVRPLAAPWTVVYQASLSTGFSRQEHWSGLPFPSPRDLPHPGNKPALQVDSLLSEPPGKPKLNPPPKKTDLALAQG